MAKFAPQQSLFKWSDRIGSMVSGLFYLSIVVSIISAITQRYHDDVSSIINFHSIESFLNTLNIVCLTLYFIGDITNNYFLIPQAENKRRDDFIDNSLGSNFSIQKSVDYYDNDGVKKGLYKVAVNLFQNCFFSYSLIKNTTLRKILNPGIFFLILIGCACIGFNEAPYAVTILQALLSADLLGSLISHFILRVRLGHLEECWINLFQNKNLQNEVDQNSNLILRCWLQYETLISRHNISIPDGVWEKQNPILTQQWLEMKVQYGIQ